MDQPEILRGIVAKLAATNADKIDGAFSFKIPSLQGSVRRAALAAAIRRQIGVNCPAAYTVSTFGELEQAVFGGVAPKNAANGAANSGAQILPDLVYESIGETDMTRCGVDIEMVEALPATDNYRDHEFYREWFSPEEIAYCLLQENPRMHFAARWCAKEALHKCDPVFRDEKMSNIEVFRNQAGEVSLRHRVNGSARMLPHALSISHTNILAAAVVVKAAMVAPVPMAAPATPQPAAASPGRNSPSLLAIVAWLFTTAIALFALLRHPH